MSISGKLFFLFFHLWWTQKHIMQNNVDTTNSDYGIFWKVNLSKDIFKKFSTWIIKSKLRYISWAWWWVLQNQCLLLLRTSFHQESQITLNNWKHYLRFLIYFSSYYFLKHQQHDPSTCFYLLWCKGSFSDLAIPPFNLDCIELGVKLWGRQDETILAKRKFLMIKKYCLKSSLAQSNSVSIHLKLKGQEI